jgi:hypothetical protein
LRVERLPVPVRPVTAIGKFALFTSVVPEIVRTTAPVAVVYVPDVIVQAQAFPLIVLLLLKTRFPLVGSVLKSAQVLETLEMQALTAALPALAKL